MSRDICVYLDFITAAHRAQIEKIAAAGGMEVHFFTSAQFDQAHACAKQAEIVYANVPDILKDCAGLKWYCCANAGVDIYCKDPSLLPSPDCMLTNSNVYGLTIAEHTVMTALMLLRRIPEYLERIQAHNWQGGLNIRSIHGIRAVMLGTGQIGRCIAERLKALGADQVIGVSRSGRAVEGFDRVLPISELDAILPQTELLIMAVPGTNETQHILSRERIALLPESALVINVGRGTAVDQDALMEALNAGRIAGAALDVVDPEPLPADHPLWTTKNLFITPHISGQNTLPYTCDRNVDSFCSDLENYIAGRPLAHLVDMQKGY